MGTVVKNVIERLKKLVNLGHEKRNACVIRHVLRLMEAPGSPAAQAGGNEAAAWAESKSWYDLIGNEKVRVRDMRELRAKAVLEDISPGMSVAVYHDVSELDFSRHLAKEDRMEIGDHRGKGYEYHPCIAWDPHAQQFLGVLHDTVIAAEGPDDADVVDYDAVLALAKFTDEERKKLPFNHRHQLACHILFLASLAPGQAMTHVADREFDDTLAMAAAREVGHYFVFRALGNRTVTPRDEQETPCAMADIVAALPMRPYKDIGLDARGHAAYGQAKPARTAKLSIGACPIVLHRPATRGGKGRRVKLDAPLHVNLVVIRELDPPPGEDPLCWILFTSLPIDTPEQCAWVGALYEQRWRIEEYFKLLKSGFQIEHTHFRQAQHIAKALVFYSLAAMALLTIKSSLGIPVIGPLDPASYAKVRHAMNHPDDLALAPDLCLFALILRCGGWLGRKTDPIGPTVLMRGMLQLTATFSLVSQFPQLIESLAAIHNADKENAYTW